MFKGRRPEAKATNKRARPPPPSPLPPYLFHHDRVRGDVHNLPVFVRQHVRQYLEEAHSRWADPQAANGVRCGVVRQQRLKSDGLQHRGSKYRGGKKDEQHSTPYTQRHAIKRASSRACALCARAKNIRVSVKGEREGRPGGGRKTGPTVFMPKYLLRVPRRRTGLR